MNHNDGKLVQSFSEIDCYDFVKQLNEKVKNSIEENGKDYILGVDEEEFKKYLIETYTLEPIEIDYENENYEMPSIQKEYVENRYGRGNQLMDVYFFTIRYPFSGSPILFRVSPRTWSMTSAEIYVNDYKKIVSFSFKLYVQDPTVFNQAKSELSQKAFANVINANKEAEIWNTQLKGIVDSHFNNLKQKYERENNFFAAINVKVNQNTTSVFTAPTIKKIVIPQPISRKKENPHDPKMNDEAYYDMLKVVYDSGKSMEKKPALYQGKDEEGLRDQFLFILETRYEGTTATGETFNRSGKTDIILKYAEDGSNLFVAECKFWHGSAEFLKAITQLFSYLTWRDSKAALIIFVTNKDFTNVIRTIQTDIKTHPCFVKENGKRGESSFSYLFHLPQDKEKYVYTEIMAFHYDK